MILKALVVDAKELEQRTGWVIKPEGACKGEVCVPLPTMTDTARVDARVLAERLRMPLLHDEVHEVWCLGPDAGVEARRQKGQSSGVRGLSRQCIVVRLAPHGEEYGRRENQSRRQSSAKERRRQTTSRNTNT